MPTNFDFFRDIGKKNHSSPINKKTHPDGWKGDANNVNAVDVVSKLNPSQVEALYDLRPVVKSRRNKDGTQTDFRKSLTRKQLAMAHYLMQGYSKRQALLKAGYSVKVAQRYTYQTSTVKTVMTYLEGMKGKLEERGINNDYIADKFKTWFEAQKVIAARNPSKEADEHTNDFIEVPDYDTQLKAYDRFEKIVNPVKMNPQDGMKKREISLTEWIKE